MTGEIMRESIRVDSNAFEKLRVNNSNTDHCEDIISNLPECIISHILSLLPTKDVVRTCVLSKEWVYKWTSIYNIDIDDGEQFSREAITSSGMMISKTSGVNFVDRIFSLLQSPTIKRFRLTCLHHYYDPSCMMAWMSDVLMRNIEDMEIVYNREGVVLPCFLFHCKSLAKLKLRMRCTLNVLGQNWFSSIKILHLAGVKIVNEHVPAAGQLMFNFPVLETLELENCKWSKVIVLEISAPALTTFKVKHHYLLSESDRCRFKILGAKIEKVDIYGHHLENIDLASSSVVWATIHFWHSRYDLLAMSKNGLAAWLLLKSFPALNNLRLSGPVVEAMTLSKHEPSLCTFNTLKQLNLSSSCIIGAFLELLHCTPSIESIIFDECPRAAYDYNYDLVEFLPSCIVNHLKEVEFRMFYGSQQEVYFADFLLRNALELKKMLGLSRKKRAESSLEKNFWENLKKVSENDELMVDSFVKSIAD